MWCDLTVRVPRLRVAWWVVVAMVWAVPVVARPGLDQAASELAAAAKKAVLRDLKPEVTAVEREAAKGVCAKVTAVLKSAGDAQKHEVGANAVLRAIKEPEISFGQLKVLVAQVTDADTKLRDAVRLAGRDAATEPGGAKEAAEAALAGRVGHLLAAYSQTRPEGWRRSYTAALLDLALRGAEIRAWAASASTRAALALTNAESGKLNEADRPALAALVKEIEEGSPDRSFRLPIEIRDYSGSVDSSGTPTLTVGWEKDQHPTFGVDISGHRVNPLAVTAFRADHSIVLTAAAKVAKSKAEDDADRLWGRQAAAGEAGWDASCRFGVAYRMQLLNYDKGWAPGDNRSGLQVSFGPTYEATEDWKTHDIGFEARLSPINTSVGLMLPTGKDHWTALNPRGYWNVAAFFKVVDRTAGTRDTDRAMVGGGMDLYARLRPLANDQLYFYAKERVEWRDRTGDGDLRSLLEGGICYPMGKHGTALPELKLIGMYGENIEAEEYKREARLTLGLGAKF